MNPNIYQSDLVKARNVLLKASSSGFYRSITVKPPIPFGKMAKWGMSLPTYTSLRVSIGVNGHDLECFFLWFPYFINKWTILCGYSINICRSVNLLQFKTPQMSTFLKQVIFIMIWWCWRKFWFINSIFTMKIVF